MFIIAHIAAGLLIGKLTGQYWVALLAATLPDLDHVPTYLRHNVFGRSFWKTVTSPDDPFGDQRSWLHSVWVWLVVCAAWLFVDVRSGIVVASGWFSHLVLDGLDASDFRPFRPLAWNLRGPVRYFSSAEFVVTAALLALVAVV